jgi:hypothetical protein
MRHGYTNATFSNGRTVVKRYRGPDAAARQHSEVTALTALADLVPVPPLLDQTKGVITLALIDGQPGQELLEVAPEQVLRSPLRLPLAVLRWQTWGQTNPKHPRFPS